MPDVGDVLGPGTLAVLLALVFAVPEPAVAQSAPISVTIPALGESADVVPIGQTAEGALDVPPQPGAIGWYADGAAPGVTGNVILDGHTDWPDANGMPKVRMFGRIRYLSQGDAIALTTDSGDELEYHVITVALYDANSLPDDVFSPPVNGQVLTLITCGGAFSMSLHKYLGSWVVQAVR